MLTFPDHQNAVYGVAVKPDGKVGFSVGEDNQLRMWNATGDKAGKQIRNAGGHGKAVFRSSRCSPEAAAAGDRAAPTARCASGTPTRGAAGKTLAGLTDYVYAVAVSPDGSLVAVGQRSTARCASGSSPTARW